MKKRCYIFSIVAIAVLALIAGYGQIRKEFAIATPDEEAMSEVFNVSALKPEFVAEVREPCAQIYPERNAYFGALHIHTDLSSDAAGWGALAGPAEAYRFAKGQSQSMRVRGEQATDLPDIQLDFPLDFAAVTDHASHFGETARCLDENSEAYDVAVCKIFRGDLRLPLPERLQPIARSSIFPLFKSNRSKRVCGDDGMACISASFDAWKETQMAAEEAYDRSSDCSFTTFVAYEYSLATEGSNLHRNVIYKGGTVPQVVLSKNDADTPEELWIWLKKSCLDSAQECDVLAIPHNSNWSSGRMFYPYTKREISFEEQQAQAILRQRFEPLAEVLQVKGDSECRNGLSGVIGAPDELCDFEKLREPAEEVEDCGDSFGSGGMQLKGCISRYSYTRYGLAAGLIEKKELGVNPFKYGLIAATDNHSGKGGAVDEFNFRGSIGVDRLPQDRLQPPIVIPTVAKADATRFNPGGIAGIWSEQNTRESLFSAMQRKETFGTSGPRIRPRFFAGWNYPEDLCDRKDGVEIAYRDGVPMGGDVPPRADASASPKFYVSALMGTHPNDGLLQKIQVIKSTITERGEILQSVTDVVGAEVMPGVNIDSCEREGGGHASLCAVWEDPDFNPDESAVYYARVVETPSCRWSTYDCNTFKDENRPEACASKTLPKMIQERAWTSPIWYSPRNKKGQI